MRTTTSSRQVHSAMSLGQVGYARGESSNQRLCDKTRFPHVNFPPFSLHATWLCCDGHDTRRLPQFLADKSSLYYFCLNFFLGGETVCHTVPDLSSLSSSCRCLGGESVLCHDSCFKKAALCYQGRVHRFLETNGEAPMSILPTICFFLYLSLNSKVHPQPSFCLSNCFPAQA